MLLSKYRMQWSKNNSQAWRRLSSEAEGGGGLHRIRLGPESRGGGRFYPPVSWRKKRLDLQRMRINLALRA